ncbi:MAG TPA: hypothetical protein PKC98_04950, partial [Candidatus Melainabacteria bacterium]|nr:hypothetical protein [Candidatus Melainabacteria bacterium]
MTKRSILTFITGLFVLTIFGLGALLIWISKPENYTSLVMTSREKAPDTANPKKAQLRISVLLTRATGISQGTART